MCGREESITLTSCTRTSRGAEIEMLQGGYNAFQARQVDYVFIATHSQELHAAVSELLGGYEYRIEVSSDFANETTSYDGFIFASSPNVTGVFREFTCPSRLEIVQKSPNALIEAVLKARESVFKAA